MPYGRRWKPSKKSIREFVQKMDEIDQFCHDNGISQSSRGDSYYFTIGDVEYRVSNHSVESSTYRDVFGNVGHYHGDSAEYRKQVVCIHASKTRIIQIFNDLKAGYELDGRGYRKN